MSDPIQGYLRARGVRYFRGHHDGEYVFLVEFADFDPGRPAGRHGKLHVHLLAAGPATGGAPAHVEVSIAPDRYFPAAHRDRLAGLAGRWHPAGGARAEIQDSCDPALVGVLVRAEGRPAGIDGVAGLVDGAVAAAIGFFSALGPTVAGPAVPGELRDAG